MKKQIPVSKQARADSPELDHLRDDHTREVRLDLAYKRLAIVNIAFYGRRAEGPDGWVLIDTGIPGTTHLIVKAAEERFGKGARPKAIIMTHGHFDHVGALENLAEMWDAPVYAHPLEAPYLNGDASYPPGDPTVGGGMMAAMARFYPRGPVNVKKWLRLLPQDGTVPGMPGWRWIHTPGHTPGHISLWDEAQKTLIAGDAFVTTRQESVYAVALQKPEIHGPPAYYTQDWAEAKASVRTLSALEPDLVVSGHGVAMRGEEMKQALAQLASGFDTIAAPEHGKYLERPAGIGSGREYDLGDVKRN
jgi:glyoxylase-like metal-dependent hydrolase (beta-lactamase superfamily II)